MSKQLRCKIAACTLALCLAAPTLHAQLAVGVKGGVSLAQMSVDGKSSGWGSSYQAGAALNVYLAEFSFGGFGLQPEVIFNSKGGVVQQSDLSQHWEDRVERLSYVEIPVGLIYLVNLGSVVPYISVAPYYSFLVEQKSEFRGLESSENRYGSSDYGVKLGGGIELRRFQISAAYSFGLCDIAKSGSQSIYNRGVEISLGYFFLNNY